MNSAMAPAETRSNIPTQALSSIMFPAAAQLVNRDTKRITNRIMLIFFDFIQLIIKKPYHGWNVALTRRNAWQDRWRLLL